MFSNFFSTFAVLDLTQPDPPKTEKSRPDSNQPMGQRNPRTTPNYGNDRTEQNPNLHRRVRLPVLRRDAGAPWPGIEPRRHPGRQVRRPGPALHARHHPLSRSVKPAVAARRRWYK